LKRTASINLRKIEIALMDLQKWQKEVATKLKHGQDVVACELVKI
jgi:hypothetical protein